VITGVHALIYAKQAEDVRAFFRDVLELKSVDAGRGWLIFALPPAELAIHPADETSHELYLMCDDLHATVAVLEGKGVKLARPISEQDWGIVTALLLPGGTELGLYEPRHPTALSLASFPGPDLVSLSGISIPLPDMPSHTGHSPGVFDSSPCSNSSFARP
jgi:predicted enzyme related to lactoylglutathione lyase